MHRLVLLQQLIAFSSHIKDGVFSSFGFDLKDVVGSLVLYFNNEKIVNTTEL